MQTIRVPFALLACVFTLALFTPPDLVGQRRRPSRADEATWSADGKYVVLGGALYDPRTGKPVDGVAARGDTGSPREGRRPADPEARKAFADALGEVMDGEVPTAALARPRPTHVTLPRLPVLTPGARSSEDRRTWATVVGDDLWVWRQGRKPSRHAIDGGAAAMRHFTFSPTGDTAYFIARENLYVLHCVAGRILQVTRDGGPETFNGELDWVYQEEVYGRHDFTGAWWDPTGENLAFMRIDESGVDTFSVVDHIPDQLEVETLKYPKAGRTNPRATLHVAGASDGELRAIDLGAYSAADEILVVRVGWTPSGDRIVYLIQDREQTWLDLNFADPATGKSERILREKAENGWVERLPMPRWLGDGGFLWESDRTGYRHFYRYGPDGKFAATVTEGDWTARNVIRLDEERGFLACYGSAPGYSIGQHAWLARLDGSGVVQLTKGRGTHRIELDPDGTMLIDRFDHLENPGEQWVRSVAGDVGHELAARHLPEDFPGALWKWFEIKARDGVLLDVAVLPPADLEADKKYPVWLDTYSGPAAPTIRDQFRPARLTWYAQLQVNVRSASLAGMHATKTCYRQFGVQELKDLEDAVDWLCAEHAWADATRVGISGWSYGGYMTAFAMTHSKKFKCGVAGAGVYDWGLYDTIYTERYMAKPQNNPEGYAKSSCVAAAPDLHGELLIIHGTMDDNVHMQNAIQFVDALQKANKMNFQFMPYAQSRHGVRSGHLGRLRDAFMRKNL